MNRAKKQTIQDLLLRLVTAGVLLIVLLMPIHAFVSTWLGTSIGPLLLWKSWKEVLLAVLVLLAGWYFCLRPDVARTLWQRRVNQVIALYVLLHLVLAFASKASAAAVVAGLMMNLRFLVIFVLVQVVVEAKPLYLDRLKQVIPHWLLWTAIGLSVLAIVQVFVLPKDFLVQFGYDKNVTIAPYILVDENPNALRAFATMRGPNTLGEYLLMPIAAALYVVYSSRRNVLAWSALGLSLVAEFLTGSRSAWLGVAMTLAVFVIMIAPRLHLARWAKRSIVPAIILALMIGWATVNVPAVRLAVFHSSPGDSSLNEGSNQKHWEATAQAIDDVVRHPWGSGPGSAGPASFYNTAGNVNLSENYYVQIGQEIGFLGLGLFLTICVLTISAIVRRKRTALPVLMAASFAGLALVNIFLHGWADDPTALTWWALAGLCLSDS